MRALTTLGAEAGSRVEGAGGSRSARGDRRWMLLASAMVTVALFAATAGLPLFSESLSHQGRVAAYSSWLDIFDPEQVPFRPLQHAYFCVLVLLQPLDPALARIPAFALYLVSALFVADLARQLGCSRAGTWLALVAYLCFPSVKALVWVAAIGNPGRVACVLLGLCLFVRHLRTPRAATGLGVLIAQVLALGFHQSGIVLAAGCALLAWADSGAPLRRGFEPTVRRLREPWLLALLALVALYTLGMGFLWAQRYPHSEPAAIVANVARASLALAPETLRHAAIEGLRRNWGGAGFAFGAASVVGAGVVYLFALRASPPRGRALLLVMAIDLVLPALSVGFVVRYAQLAAALGACVLALGHDRSAARPRARRALGLVMAFLCAAYAADTVHDAVEYRRAGAVVRGVLADAAAVRARVGPRAEVVIVDLPDVWGRERDIPMFNWGTPRSLAQAGAHGRWTLVRTRPGISSSEAQLVSPAELEALAAERARTILVFDAATARLVELDEGS